MYDFYGDEGFSANCFLLKKDLLSYLNALKNEYFNPSQNYQKKDDFPVLWEKRMKKIESLDEIIYFTIKDLHWIQGERGYINSDDDAFQIMREIALPLVSYIYVEKLGNEQNPLYYWKLFVDFISVNEIKNGPLVFKYGKKKEELPSDEPEAKKEAKEVSIREARSGQGRYRELLIEQCRFCPFTMIADERLLIASHIKPWVASNDDEKTDPYNGYLLSPLYDKLFDQGYITFTKSKKLILSKFISSYTWKQIKLENNMFVKALPMDEKRYEYLKFHHDNVFKGNYDLED